MFSSPPAAVRSPNAVRTSIVALSLLWVCLATPPSASGEAFSSPDGIWTAVEQVPFPERFSPPTEFAAARLDLLGLLSVLAAAPTTERPGASARTYLPLPDGELMEVTVQQSSAVEPEIAALFPELQTFVFQSTLELGISGRLAVGPGGLYVLGRGPNQMLRVEPVQTVEGVFYVSYFGRNRTKGKGGLDVESAREPHGACGELQRM